MNRLWAPWRISYIKASKESKCIFCGAAQRSSKNHYLVFKTHHSLCMLNLYPYNNGHLMVAPLRHTGNLGSLPDKEILDLMKAVLKAKRLLDKTLKPRGYNIGINIGDIAGAGFPGHVHIHVVPRWKGDTNFMPVLNGTKVISQSLDALCRELKRINVKQEID